MRKIEYVVSDERLITPSEDKQHCQSGTPEFLAETITAVEQMTENPLLFRTDSGNEALENMLLLHWHDPQLKFLIKHNLRREDRYAIAEEQTSDTAFGDTKPEKEVWIV